MYLFLASFPCFLQDITYCLCIWLGWNFTSFVGCHNSLPAIISMVDLLATDFMGFTLP